MAQVLHVVGRVLHGPGRGADEDAVGELWAVDGRVVAGRPAGDHDVTTLEGWAVPGLVDAHCHIGLGALGLVDDETALEQARTDRDSGVLLVRDAGSPADTRWVQRRDDLPRLVRAGRHVARTRRYLRDYAVEVEPDGLVEEVRRQARAGDGWVKVVGDWIDRSAGAQADLAPCWPPEVLAAAAEAVHAEGARVTAHVFGEEALADVLAAGFDGVEHATGAGPAEAVLMAERGTTVVPTLVNIGTFPDIAARAEPKFPRYAAHMRALHGRRHENVARLRAAGVRLAAGTDAGGVQPHGIIAAEVAEMARAVGAPAALDAACWSSRRWLGEPSLDEGGSADLVVLAGDPREDVAVLAEPRAVVLRGRVVAAGGRRLAG